MGLDKTFGIKIVIGRPIPENHSIRGYLCDAGAEQKV